jgi:hypothetical protein
MPRTEGELSALKLYGFIITKKALLLTQTPLTLLSLTWSVIIYKYSRYGTWHIYPVLGAIFGA